MAACRQCKAEFCILKYISPAAIEGSVDVLLSTSMNERQQGVSERRHQDASDEIRVGRFYSKSGKQLAIGSYVS